MDKDIIIWDIDGTISDTEHRLHHIQTPGKKKNWKAFFEELVLDPIIEPVAYIYWTMQEFTGKSFYLITGRPENYRESTEYWLEQKFFHYDELYMRPKGDFRPDVEVKREIVDMIGADRVLFAVEDRSRVVKMYRDLGIICLQPREGDF